MNFTAETILFTGGCRSGKSDLALRWAESMGGQRIFIATASADDARQYNDLEMLARIDRHRAGRGSAWKTLEVPFNLVDVLDSLTAENLPVLVDCVTLWLGNMLGAGFSSIAALAEVERLGTLLAGCPMPVALVTNEVGLGLVPENALGRQFRDLAGEANQILARSCGVVIFVACGLPLALKGALPDCILQKNAII